MKVLQGLEAQVDFTVLTSGILMATNLMFIHQPVTHKIERARFNIDGEALSREWCNIYGICDILTHFFKPFK